MGEVIFEEFKGTDNMELHLNRHLAKRRVCAALESSLIKYGECAEILATWNGSGDTDPKKHDHEPGKASLR